MSGLVIIAPNLFARTGCLLNPSLLLGLQEPFEGVLVCGVNLPFSLLADCAKHKQGSRSARAGVGLEPLGTAT